MFLEHVGRDTSNRSFEHCESAQTMNTQAGSEHLNEEETTKSIIQSCPIQMRKSSSIVESKII